MLPLKVAVAASIDPDVITHPTLILLDVVFPCVVTTSRVGVDTLVKAEPSPENEVAVKTPTTDATFFREVFPKSRLSPDCNSCNWFALGL
jgi:hypothetical protein